MSLVGSGACLQVANLISRSLKEGEIVPPLGGAYDFTGGLRRPATDCRRSAAEWWAQPTLLSQREVNCQMIVRKLRECAGI